ncbi:MAG: hypothetical protein ACLSX5_03210 [Lachnospiraceae bacterium]
MVRQERKKNVKNLTGDSGDFSVKHKMYGKKYSKCLQIVAGVTGKDNCIQYQSML